MYYGDLIQVYPKQYLTDLVENAYRDLAGLQIILALGKFDKVENGDAGEYSNMFNYLLDSYGCVEKSM